MSNGGNDRRLSPLDAAFLYFERPQQRLHVGCVAVLERSLPLDDLIAAIDERLVRPFPRYRQRPARRPLDWDRPAWTDEAQFDVRRHVRHVAVPQPGDAAALQRLVDALFATRLDPAHPLWEIYLVDGLADGRAVLLCKMHHSMIDGISGAQVLAALADPLLDTPQSTLPATVGASTPGAWGWNALVEGARDVVEVGRLLASLLQRPAPPIWFNGRLSDARRIVWASFAFDDLLAVRGATGVTMNDVVLAIVAGALRRALLARGQTPPAGGVRILTPVSTRRPDERLQLGNLVTAMFPSLPVDVADPAERLRRIAHETRGLKARGQARAVARTIGLMDWLPAPLTALAGRLMPDGVLVNTICTNVPGPREQRRLLDVPIEGLHPVVPLFFGMGVEFAVMSYGNTLSITAVADPHLVGEIGEFEGWLHESAAELCRMVQADAARPPVVADAAVVRVGDLMSAPVATVRPQASMAEASTAMTSRRLRHLPVVDERGRLVGLVTHRDLLLVQPSALELPVEGDRLALLARLQVAEVMETHLAVVAPDEPAASAGEQLSRHRIGCLPVVRGDGQLVGILTRTDFLRWATRQMGSPAAPIAVAS